MALRRFIAFFPENVYKNKDRGKNEQEPAIVADEGFDLLDAPIKRVTAPDTPIPFSPVLEATFMPNEEKIVRAVKELF